MKSILIVDGNKYCRDTIKHFLNDGEFSVDAEVNDGYEALQLLMENSYTVIISDINLHQMSGFELLEKIKLNHPEQKVLILSTHSDEWTIRKIISMGACGCIPKNISEAELKRALNMVVDGETVFQIKAGIRLSKNS